MRIFHFILLGLLMLSLSAPSLCLAKAKTKQIIKIAYFSQKRAVPAALSNLDPFIQNKGMSGAKIALEENNTTGKFTGQQYQLTNIVVPIKGDIKKAFVNHVSADTHFVVVNLPVVKLKQLADLKASQQKLLFDVNTRDDGLRGQQCRANVLHLQPSRAMRADALAQFMLKKRWKKWFLVTGPLDNDRLYAEAFKRSAKKFGLKIIAEKKWTHTHDARRTAQSDIPVFTQDIKDYDVLVVTDEKGVFGEYLSYRTWMPRPVIGTQGLIATSWHATHEQWGAVQIQNRFKEMTGRIMQEADYGAYLAIKAIGEASVRIKTNQFLPIKSYLLSDKFVLQGYKGKSLSFRQWNGQLRQPILLAAPRSLVSVAPVEGFLHPKTELDTLGFDAPEARCEKKQ
ncbi:MAG: ABC transporter substrate-binding protein [Methylococcales bacterium]|nr:ABC transporter substrate-binding protein [Methylococcales bacterium]